MSIHQRIYKIIRALELENKEFAKRISVKESSLSNSLSRGTDFRVSICEKILKVFPEISSDYLMTGVGEMWRGEKGKDCTELEQRVSELESDKEDLKNLIYFQRKRIEELEKELATANSSKAGSKIYSEPS